MCRNSFNQIKVKIKSPQPATQSWSWGTSLEFTFAQQHTSKSSLAFPIENIVKLHAFLILEWFLPHSLSPCPCSSLSRRLVFPLHQLLQVRPWRQLRRPQPPSRWTARLMARLVWLTMCWRPNQWMAPMRAVRTRINWILLLFSKIYLKDEECEKLADSKCKTWTYKSGKP